MVQIKRVLFPIDFTENSSEILPYVLSISENMRPPFICSM